MQYFPIFFLCLWLDGFSGCARVGASTDSNIFAIAVETQAHGYLGIINALILPPVKVSGGGGVTNPLVLTDSVTGYKTTLTKSASGHALDLTTELDVTVTPPGAVGNALSLDGVSKHVVLASMITMPTNAAMSFWAKPTFAAATWCPFFGRASASYDMFGYLPDPYHWSVVIANGASVTLTNSTSLSLPGGNNITTGTGDALLALYNGSGVWSVLSYTRHADPPFIPAGAVMAFNLSACPAGWSAANGSGGTVNLVGYFIRGLDTAGTVDPGGRTLASVEGFALQTHTHSFSPGFVVSGGSGNSTNGGGGLSNNVAASVGGVSGAVTATETRPVNVALLYCQKN